MSKKHKLGYVVNEDREATYKKQNHGRPLTVAQRRQLRKSATRIEHAK